MEKKCQLWESENDRTIWMVVTLTIRIEPLKIWSNVTINGIR